MMTKDFDVTKNRIKFSLLWDKLNDPEFTTIRSWNTYKEDYYRSRIGQEFQVWKVRNVYSFKLEYVICHAFLLDVKHMKSKDIVEATLRKDVSLNGQPNADWIIKIMKNDDVLLLTFSKERKGQQRLNIGEALR